MPSQGLLLRAVPHPKERTGRFRLVSGMSDHLLITADGIGGTGALDAGQIATAAAFLQLLTPTRTATFRSPSSYGLKHDAERWGRVNGMEPYVSNGALIAAAVALGLPVRHFGRGSFNVTVGVSVRDLRRVREAMDDAGA